MADHDKNSDIKEDSATNNNEIEKKIGIIAGIVTIIGGIVGIIATFLNSNGGSASNNNENHSDPIIVNNNNNNIYLPSETEHKDETSESTTTTYSDTVLYEETSAFSTVPSYTQPPSTSIAYTEPSYNTETSVPHKTEPSYNSYKSTTTTSDDIDVWDILLNDTTTQKNSTTQKSSVKDTTTSEEIWSGYVYQVALEKQKPNLLRFTVQGNLDIFSLQDEQKWETSIKSNGLFYAARLNTIGKEILSNKVYSFEYKNGGIYYFDTDIPITSYYDSTRDVFIIEVTINDQDTFESSSLETNTIAIIHDFY